MIPSVCDDRIETLKLNEGHHHNHQLMELSPENLRTQLNHIEEFISLTQNQESMVSQIFR